ncbi:hypothetical protein P879_10611 [Paragonimus westermani]|uniref:peptidyl-tRNA hydrolase n=1 Tax=Paragonimus westermani TaxID=34504 RepID=A0A8T0D795_9TREM|nr:hypothetical protein P879_10611 [Paragonimus westermani]
MSTTLLQYIVVRRDLSTVLNWPLGAIVAQGCHAATAALHTFREHSNTLAYLNQLDRMHKVVLGVSDLQDLQQLANRLSENQIQHYLWIEQPENVCTCLATRPYPKAEVQSYFKGLKLL